MVTTVIIPAVKRFGSKENQIKTFSFMHKAHWVLLLLSLLTIAGWGSGKKPWTVFIKKDIPAARGLLI